MKNHESGSWNDLSRLGLRVHDELDLRGQRRSISFEAPAQINNAPLYLYSNITLGMYTYIRTGNVRHVKSIGRYTSVGPYVLMGEAEHPINWLSSSPCQYFPEQFDFYPPERKMAAARAIKRTEANDSLSRRGRVTIGNDVWIGANVIIRRGVTIGDGAIIAAGSFVNKDVAPYSIVAGTPAKHKRFRFEEPITERLKALRWWEFDINDLAGVPFDKMYAYDEGRMIGTRAWARRAL